MRLRSLLVLSYAAVATALTNVGFGGKRDSYKHFQDLDLGLDCDSDRLSAVAIAFVLGAQNLAAIPGGAPNLALARLAGWEYWLRGDPNTRGCFIQSCATPCRRRNCERTRAVQPLAAWSDPNPKGMVCIIPSSFITIWGTLWYHNWPATMPGGGAEVPDAFESDPRVRHRRVIRHLHRYVNNDINNPGTSGLPGNGIARRRRLCTHK